METKVPFMVVFSPVTENDLGCIREIYDYYILNTTATFHNEPITIPELRDFLFIAHPRYPSFIIKESNEIVGYCFLTRYKTRQAYDRTAEMSIYMKPAYTGRGIGALALKHPEDAAKKPVSTLSSEPCAQRTRQVSGLWKRPDIPAVQT